MVLFVFLSVLQSCRTLLHPFFFPFRFHAIFHKWNMDIRRMDSWIREEEGQRPYRYSRVLTWWTGWFAGMLCFSVQDPFAERCRIKTLLMQYYTIREPCSSQQNKILKNWALFVHTPEETQLQCVSYSFLHFLCRFKQNSVKTKIFWNKISEGSLRIWNYFCSLCGGNYINLSRNSKTGSSNY